MAFLKNSCALIVEEKGSTNLENLQPGLCKLFRVIIGVHLSKTCENIVRR